MTENKYKKSMPIQDVQEYIIDIDTDDDFHFSGDLPAPVPGLAGVRDWIWNNCLTLSVNNSAERQKDYIKLHKGNRTRLIEKELEDMYSSTYTQESYYRSSGNWSFGYKISRK